jgi:hypothetical protein
MKDEKKWSKSINDKVSELVTSEEHGQFSMDMELSEQQNETLTLHEADSASDVRNELGAWSHGLQNAVHQRYSKYFADESQDDPDEFLLHDDTMKMLDL